MIGWQQDYVCWKCRDRISCPPDKALLWEWIRTPDIAAFEAKHVACDDGFSVGLELLLIDMDGPHEPEAGRSIAVAGSNDGRGAAA